MFVLMFTRLTGQEESIFLLGTYETHSEAHEAMVNEYLGRVYGDMGWDPKWSNYDDDQAFCGTEDMYDTCRYFIFDTEFPVGFSNDRTTEFLSEDEIEEMISDSK